ncbi:ubiquitin-conjugating enzyme E2 O [Entomortierella parvispora]|uniref:Ubiquitin-conjugating enzyme E2 O n=1 Tax=Entomortierella parvispora TaxID=205924 RepID=A0A9P3H5B8_9FUNG|nr:ubiquitin-conjugating enzyme E2 O [Entomortierella parvispora]
MAKPLITARVFLEDAVHHRDNSARLGLVVKTWHDFDAGESDSEDEDNIGPLALQQVVVHWVDGSAPQTVHEDDLVVVDRSFSHGDVVKRSPNDIMSGTVIDVKVELDLEKICPPMTQYLGTNAKHVDFVQQFVVNNHVIYDGWLGVIEEVKDELTVLMNDSSVCVVKDSDSLDLRDQTHDQSCFFPDSLAPGHRVIGPSRVFKEAEYLVGSYSGEKQGYVLRSDITSITVNWLSFNPLALDQTPGVSCPPRVLDDFESIVVYKSAEQHCTYELLDRVKITDADTLQAFGLQQYCPYLKSKSTREKCPNASHNHGSKYATSEMKIIGTKTKVTVQWQDLSISEDIISTDLVPYLNMDDQDVWPTDYVLLKAGEVLMDEPGGLGFDRKKSDMLGIVQSVNAKERTTQIKWFSEERDQGLEAEPEEFSLYEIMSHPDLKFRMGDMVVVSREREQAPSSDIAPRAPSVDDILSLVGRGSEIFNELMKSQGASGHAAPQQSITRDASVLLLRYGVEGLEALDRFLSESNKMASKALYWLVDRGDPLKPMIPDDVLMTLSQIEQDIQTIRPRLNWVGQIWEVYRDRPAVLVRFMDGTEAEFPVGRIMVIEDDDDEDDDDDDDEDDQQFEEYDFDDEGEEVSSDGSWETDSGEEDDSMSDLDEETSEAKTDKDKELASVGGEALPAAAPVPSSGAVSASVPQSSSSPAPDGDIEPKATGSAVITTTVDPLVEGLDEVDSLRTTVPEHAHWKSFMIVDHTPADHHYLSCPQPDGDKAWFRRIAKEHEILRSSLPDGIRVRAFGDRLDLLRVLIQGPDHTPYRNALFLFDFILPSQFPSQPPAAFFHSWTGGIGRINPNLYEDGNVCLSLLNTWHGKDQTETWTPSSSILQLLISLQGLVLVPEPYYNESGFEKFVGTKEAARNSELYNEKVYLLSLKTIQTLLNNPPLPFEREVRYFYFHQKKLEQTVIEGFELIAAAEDGVADEVVEEGQQQVTSDSSAETNHGPVIKRISRGALKMLKKHIDTLSLSIEE